MPGMPGISGEHIKDNDHDFAVEVSDGEEQNSEDEEGQEEDDDGTKDLTKTQNQKFQNWKADNSQPQPKGGKPAAI